MLKSSRRKGEVGNTEGQALWWWDFVKVLLQLHELEFSSSLPVRTPFLVYSKAFVKVQVASHAGFSEDIPGLPR